MTGRVMITGNPPVEEVLAASCFVCLAHAKHSFDQHHKAAIAASREAAAKSDKIAWVPVDKRWICPPVMSAVTYGITPALPSTPVPVCWTHCPSMAPNDGAPAQTVPPAPPGWRPSGRN